MGGQMGCRLLFLCFVLWPRSGRLCKTFTKQGAHPKLAQLQRSGLLGLRPGGTSSGCCGGPALRGNLWIGRLSRSGRGGVSAWHGECNQRDTRSGLRVLFWAPELSDRSRTEPGPPQARGYGSGPGEDEAHAGIGSVSGASSKRNTASCTTLPAASVSRRDLS